jgi:hypothetical protein
MERYFTRKNRPYRVQTQRDDEKEESADAPPHVDGQIGRHRQAAIDERQFDPIGGRVDHDACAVAAGHAAQREGLYALFLQFDLSGVE